MLSEYISNETFRGRIYNISLCSVMCGQTNVPDGDHKLYLYNVDAMPF